MPGRPGTEPIADPPQLPAGGRAHGTEARYQSGPDEQDVPGRGCHCRACRRAHRAAANHRSRMQAYGRWEPFTEAEPARAWVRMLMEHPCYPIGQQRIAELAGVSPKMVSRLLYGLDGQPPSRRIRPENDARIRAVQPTLANLADNTPTDPTGTRRRLQALVACGWPPCWLYARLGWQKPFFDAVMRRRDRVAAKTARAVLVLYSELWNQTPPQATKAEGRAVARAQQLAERCDWPLPQAWDDEAIDDPGAEPEDCRRPGHRSQAVLVAEAQELMASPAETVTGQSLTRQQAADRLGVTRECLDTALLRHARAGRTGSQEAA